MDPRGSKKVRGELYRMLKYIRECNLKGTPVYFDMLVEGMDLERSEVSRLIDILFDFAALDGSWSKVDGSWRRTFSVNEDVQSLADVICEAEVKE